MLSKTNFTLVKGTLMGVLFFCSFQVLAQNWRDLQWQRLLIYRDTLTGVESEADDSSFFVHPEGKYEPKKELEALIASLQIENPDPKKNIYCRFPARIRWLRKYMTVPESKVVCEDYIKFRDRLAAKSISVVFSSYYPNNPGSTFGHTFIRLGKQKNEERDVDSTSTELLDTGINYGAMTEGAGPVIFAIGGLAGWFYGNYNAVPYYYKVREYNDFETRDLWSYQLDMTQEEIDLIVDHIWELGHTKFDYFFLTENCSYHVLSILESARPSLYLHEHLPRLYTIPSETLKALEAEKIVRKITFRPAASTQFYHQLSMLNKEEANVVKSLVLKNKPVPEYAAEKKALIYDSALSLVDYRYAKKILKGDEEAQNLKRPLLIARSKIPIRSEELDFSEQMKEAPHLTHGQKRVAFTLLNRDSKNFVDLEWRFAFHDILDNSLGYPPRTKLDIMKAAIRDDGDHLQFRDFSFMDVMQLGKWDDFTRSASWKVKLGHWQTRRDGDDLSTEGFVGGYGFSYQFDKFTPFALAHLEGSYVTERLHKFKFGYGADLGLLTEFSNSWKLWSTLEWRVHPWDESRVLNELRYSNRSFGVGGFHQSYLIDGVQEAGLRLFKYL